MAPWPTAPGADQEAASGCAPLALVAFVGLAAQLAAALAALAAAGVAHRDVKLDNVLLRPPPPGDEGGGARWALTDFGAGLDALAAGGGAGFCVLPSSPPVASCARSLVWTTELFASRSGAQTPQSSFALAIGMLHTRLCHAEDWTSPLT